MMQKDELYLYVYDTSMILVAVIDRYSSLIWTDRYDNCGDFEISLPYEPKWSEVLRKDYFCRTTYSDHWAVIEKIEESKEEDGPLMMTVSGRSLESILERRVVIGKTEFGSDEQHVSVQSSIISLLISNIISPSNPKRRIGNFTYILSGDTDVMSKTFAESYDGDDLLSIIEGICEDKHLGFKITVSASNQFIFELYSGKKRNVIFSTDYDILKSSNYFTSTEEYRNVMFVLLENETYISVYSGGGSEPSGLNRREVYESDSKMEDVELYETQVNNKLIVGLNKTSSSKSQIQAKALKKLKRDYKIQTGFEGEIVSDNMYRYGIDYYVGDRVQFKDMFGNMDSVYISEVVISNDENGLTILPTFKEIDWE